MFPGSENDGFLFWTVPPDLRQVERHHEVHSLAEMGGPKLIWLDPE